jgi:hypothetical protein
MANLRIIHGGGFGGGLANDERFGNERGNRCTQHLQDRWRVFFGDAVFVLSQIMTHESLSVF